MAQVHDHLPVILKAADWPVLLSKATGDDLTLVRAAARSVSWARLCPVSPTVNSVRNGAERLESLGRSGEPGLTI